jgi:hypothetical protein
MLLFFCLSSSDCIQKADAMKDGLIVIPTRLGYGHFLKFLLRVFCRLKFFISKQLPILGGRKWESKKRFS